jgi:hypothetical protein
VAFQVQIRISDEGGDLGLLEEATAGLRAELLELDVIDVMPIGAGQAPPGTRGAGAAVVGDLLVTINQVPILLGNLVAVVRHWLSRDRGGRTAELVIAGDSLVVTGITGAEQERLIGAWLRAHSLDQVAQG